VPLGFPQDGVTASGAVETGPKWKGGTSRMASIDEVRAGIALANEKASESVGALQQAHAALEEAQAMLMQVTEGSGQADVAEANGFVAQALGAVADSQQAVKAAIAASEGVANRL
jgi:hypothetical protein